jgi:hypothetical protein
MVSIRSELSNGIFKHAIYRCEKREQGDQVEVEIQRQEAGEEVDGAHRESWMRQVATPVYEKFVTFGLDRWIVLGLEDDLVASLLKGSFVGLADGYDQEDSSEEKASKG